MSWDSEDGEQVVQGDQENEDQVVQWGTGENGDQVVQWGTSRMCGISYDAASK
jgi:hypothetical protein